MTRTSHGNKIKLGRSFWLDHPIGACLTGVVVGIAAVYALIALGVM